MSEERIPWQDPPIVEVHLEVDGVELKDTEPFLDALAEKLEEKWPGRWDLGASVRTEPVDYSGPVEFEVTKDGMDLVQATREWNEAKKAIVAFVENHRESGGAGWLVAIPEELRDAEMGAEGNFWTTFLHGYKEEHEEP